MADGDWDRQELLEVLDDSPCGHALTAASGTILRMNRTLRLMARLADEAALDKFQDLFTAGTRIYYETHLRPLLTMQGAIREVALELRRGDQEPLPVLLNAKVVSGGPNSEATISWVVMNASDRRRYERELLAGRQRAELAESAARELAANLSESNADLQRTLAELRESALYIRKLEGILPICMGCKSVRSDDDKDWVELDHYLMRTGAVALSHSICPECTESFEAS